MVIIESGRSCSHKSIGVSEFLLSALLPDLFPQEDANQTLTNTNTKFLQIIPTNYYGVEFKSKIWLFNLLWNFSLNYFRFLGEEESRLEPTLSFMKRMRDSRKKYENETLQNQNHRQCLKKANALEYESHLLIYLISIRILFSFQYISKKNSMKQILILLTWISLLPLFVAAQTRFEKRIDMEIPDYCQNYQAHKMGGAVTIVSFEKNLVAGKTTEYNFNVYDSNLDLITSKKIVYGFRLGEYESIARTEKTIHVLKYVYEGDYTLMSYNLEKDEVKKFTGKFPKKFKVRELVVLGEQAYAVGVTFSDMYIIATNWQTNKQKTYPIKIDGLNSARVNYIGSQKNEKEKDIVFYYRTAANKKTIDVFSYHGNDEGIIGNPVNLTSSFDEFVHTSKTQTQNGFNDIITGTYDKNKGLFPEGIFFANTLTDKKESLNYYPLSSLSDFNKIAKEQFSKLEPLPSIMAPIKRSKPEELNMIQHPIKKLEDGYLVMGEIFYPTIGQGALKNGANPSAGTYDQFSGYQYTMAFVFKIDLQGKMLWSTSFPMFINERPYQNFMGYIYIDPPVAITFLESKISSDTLKIAYLNSTQVVYRTYTLTGEILQNGELEVGIKTIPSNNQEILNSGLKYWYDDYYLAFGSIHSNEKLKRGEKEKLNQFFLVKVKVD
jgi:hypothetical protein